ncbi:MAG TPA: acetyltransferase [Dyadobacter sp.]|jgi:sugar O-acyltransferase (sialic acid O-acetyltransferase NeuD family)|nr:acetyltransferase [Dyadobacter sp.]
MLIYGAGGHARVLISCLTANNIPVTAIFDDDLSKDQISGYKVNGGYNPDQYQNQQIFIAIGNNALRHQIAQRVSHAFGIQAHPSALIDKSVTVGPGTVLLHGSIIQTGSQIGEQVIINTGARVDHDCRIGDYVHIAPGCTLCGGVSVGSFTVLGAGTVVVPGIHIGKHCFIAAGSVITRDIPDGSIVRGNPGRILKQPS